MTRRLIPGVRGIIFLAVGGLLLSGCVVRTYTQVKERVDQDLISGNRGYIEGVSPTPPKSDRPTTRTQRVIEIELYPPLKFDKAKPESKAVAPRPKVAVSVSKVEDDELWGNRGFVQVGPVQEESILKKSTLASKTQTYKVKQKDTLQKISLKFYGTTRKWPKIYEANRDRLSSPSKIYPGQTLIIPSE